MSQNKTIFSEVMYDSKGRGNPELITRIQSHHPDSKLYLFSHIQSKKADMSLTRGSAVSRGSSCLAKTHIVAMVIVAMVKAVMVMGCLATHHCSCVV